MDSIPNSPFIEFTYEPELWNEEEQKIEIFSNSFLDSKADTGIDSNDMIWLTEEEEAPIQKERTMIDETSEIDIAESILSNYIIARYLFTIYSKLIDESSAGKRIEAIKRMQVLR